MTQGGGREGRHAGLEVWKSVSGLSRQMAPSEQEEAGDWEGCRRDLWLARVGGRQAERGRWADRGRANRGLAQAKMGHTEAGQAAGAARSKREGRGRVARALPA